MSSFKEIKEEIRSIYEERRNQAEAKGEARHASYLARYPELARAEQQVANAGADLVVASMGAAQAEEALQQLRAAEDRRLALVKRLGIPEDYADPVWTCPICKDTGYHDGHNCICYDRQFTPRLHSALHLDQLKDMGFDRFDLTLFDDQPREGGPSIRATMDRFKQMMEAYADSFIPGKKDNLLFIGPPGTGKTFMAGCIANRLDKRDIKVFYLPASTLFQQIQAYRKQQNAYSPDREALEEGESFYELLTTAPLLIIDDLGTENAPPAERLTEWLQLLNIRAHAPVNTIISTNLDARELKQMYDERLLSRIYGGFKPIAFSGNDLRLMRRKRS